MTTLPRKREPSNIGLYALLVIVIIGFITFKMRTGLKHKSVKTLTTDHISGMNFNGKVTGFTFDGTRQNTKIAVLSDGYNFAIYNQWVNDIELGDSLVKQKGSLQVTVYKPKKDKVVLDYGPLLRKLEMKGW